jgi:hypothetical protein
MPFRGIRQASEQGRGSGPRRAPLPSSRRGSRTAATGPPTPPQGQSLARPETADSTNALTIPRTIEPRSRLVEPEVGRATSSPSSMRPSAQPVYARPVPARTSAIPALPSRPAPRWRARRRRGRGGAWTGTAHWLQRMPVPAANSTAIPARVVPETHAQAAPTVAHLRAPSYLPRDARQPTTQPTRNRPFPRPIP